MSLLDLANKLENRVASALPDIADFLKNTAKYVAQNTPQLQGAYRVAQSPQFQSFASNPSQYKPKPMPVKQAISQTLQRPQSYFAPFNASSVASKVPGSAWSTMSPIEPAVAAAIEKRPNTTFLQRYKDQFVQGGNIPGALESRGVPSLAAWPIGLAAAVAIPGAGELGLTKNLKAEKVLEDIKPSQLDELGRKVTIDRTKLSGRQLSMSTQELMDRFGNIPKTISKIPEVTQQEAEQQLTNAVMHEADQADFLKAFKKYVGERQAATTTAYQTAQPFSKLPASKAKDFIDYIEGVKPSNDPQILDLAKKWQGITDNLFVELKDLSKTTGQDPNYLRGYVTHIWEQTPAEVQNVLNRSSKFANSRQIPTYDEGIALGLKPKFKNPAEILQAYVRNLENLKANTRFFETLKNQGIIVDAGVARNTPGFKAIIATGFPNSRVSYNGQTVIGDYAAPTDIANQINRFYSPIDSGTLGKILEKTAKISGGLQDVLMSGGIPKTPINAWTAAQIMWRDLPAGRIRGPLKALFTAFSQGATDKYLLENSDVIREMQTVDVSPVGLNVADSIDKGIIRNLFGENLGQVWRKLTSEATFRRFAPINEIEFYKDIKAQALKSAGESDALDIAAQATKNFFGNKGVFATAMEDKTWRDGLTTAFFAPRYRETIANFLVNNLKAIKNPTALENRANVKWLLGALGTYLMFDAANYQSTGHHMNDNPPGYEDRLMVPFTSKDGTQRYLGITWMSSILTLPRAGYKATKAALSGNVGGVLAEGKNTLSSLVRPVADLATNQDYFGRQIYNPEASGGQQIGQVASYLNPVSGAYTHPYLQAFLNPRNADLPTYQKLAMAGEVPVRFTTQNSINARQYYDVQDKVLQGLPADSIKAYRFIHPQKELYTTAEPDNVGTVAEKMQKATIRANDPYVYLAERAIALQTAKDTGRPLDPLYEADQETAMRYFRYQSLPPSSPDGKSILKTFPEVLDLIKVRSSFFEANPITSTTSSVYDTKPQPTPAQQMAMDRGDWNFPGVKEYLNANAAWNNQQRLLLGLPAIASGYGGYSSYNKKSAPVKKTKATLKLKKSPTIKVKPLPRLKLKPSPTLQLAKATSKKTLAKPKPIKVTIRPTKSLSLIA